MTTSFVGRCVALSALLFSPFERPVIGQPRGAAANTRPASVAAPTSPFAKLPFRNIGPATPSGRVDDLAVLETNPAVFYVASATGGLWKTTNHGTTFDEVFDSETTSSIGDVAIAPMDANLVWVGTGENNNRQSSSWGDGVYKSTDGGRSWKNMGLRNSRQIARIIVDPVDHDVVYVAALGDLWAGGGERGVYKTADGGLTWSRVLEAGPDAGATELVMDPSNNKVLYAATYQRRRATWGFNGGGPASALWKSTDAGRSWMKLTKGIPEGPLGRIGLDIFRQNPNVVYARIEHPTESGVYRSDDAGTSWRKLSTTNPRPMYFSQIRVDPTTDSRVYVLGVQLHVSDDGGRTFTNEGARNIHVDFHAMWIDPNNPSHIILGGDGGVGISWDRSKTYQFLTNLPLAQFYHVAYDMQSPYTVCGGLQDNNTWCGPSAVRNQHGIANDDWFIISGGDGFVAQIDPSDPRIMYGESQDGRMSRVDRVTNERKSIRPEAPQGEKAYRWNWDTPLLLSPHDPATVFVAANRVFKSVDRGHSWKAISPDLTTATDRDELELMGVKGKDTKIARNDGVGSYGNLVSFAESRMKKGVYWAGSDDGQVHVSRDDGATWTNVTAKIPGLGKNTYVSRLEPSRFAEGTVYATFDGHRLGNYERYVYASSDFGNSWSSIVGDLPGGEVARTIAEDVKNKDVLYLGTESGLWFSPDRGKRWMRVRGTLPTVPVYEITLHPRENDMLLATHGRGVWILDDLTPFQEYGRAVAAESFIFPVDAVAQRNPSAERMREFEGDLKFLGRNPPRGAVVAYHIKQPAKAAKLTVRDAAGTVVREITSDTSARPVAGINVVEWDLRVAPLRAPRLGGGQQGGGFFGPGLDGPLVLPGDYRLTLAVDGRDVGTATVAVRADPEITITDTDRRTHFETLKDLHTLQQTANEAAEVLVATFDQLEPVRTAMRDSAKVPEPVRGSWKNFSTQLDTLRRQFGLGGGGGFGGPPNVRTQISQLKQSIMASTSLPTETQLRMIGEAKAALPKRVAEVNALVERLPTLYGDLAKAGIYPSVPRAVGAVGGGSRPE